MTPLFPGIRLHLYRQPYSQPQEKHAHTYKKLDCLLIWGRPPTDACIQLHLVTSGYMAERAVTPYESPFPKTPWYTQTSWLYVLQNGIYCCSKFYIAGMSQLPNICMEHPGTSTRPRPDSWLVSATASAHFVPRHEWRHEWQHGGFCPFRRSLGAFFYWTRFLENNVPFDNIPL